MTGIIIDSNQDTIALQCAYFKSSVKVHSKYIYSSRAYVIRESNFRSLSINDIFYMEGRFRK